MRFRSLLQIALIFFLLLQTLSLRADRYLPQDYDDSRLPGLLSIVIEQIFCEGDDTKIRNRGRNGEPTGIFSDCFPSQDNLDFSDWQTFLNLKKEGQVVRILENNFEPPARYPVVPRDLLDAQLNDEVIRGGLKSSIPILPVSFRSRPLASMRVKIVRWCMFHLRADPFAAELTFTRWKSAATLGKSYEPAASCTMFY